MTKSSSQDPVSEREKWDADIIFKKQELVLKEREQGARDRELDLKQKELDRSKWSSPLIVAIIAAATAEY